MGLEQGLGIVMCMGQQAMGPETGNRPPGLVRFWVRDLGELGFLRGIGLGLKGFGP